MPKIEKPSVENTQIQLTIKRNPIIKQTASQRVSLENYGLVTKSKASLPNFRGSYRRKPGNIVF